MVRRNRIVNHSIVFLRLADCRALAEDSAHAVTAIKQPEVTSSLAETGYGCPSGCVGHCLACGYACRRFGLQAVYTKRATHLHRKPVRSSGICAEQNGGASLSSSSVWPDLITSRVKVELVAAVESSYSPNRVGGKKQGVVGSRLLFLSLPFLLIHYHLLFVFLRLLIIGHSFPLLSPSALSVTFLQFPQRFLPWTVPFLAFALLRLQHFPQVRLLPVGYPIAFYASFAYPLPDNNTMNFWPREGARERTPKWRKLNVTREGRRKSARVP